MSGLDDSILCDGVDKISSDNKTCISYAEHCKKDGAENSGDSKSKSDDVNSLSDGMGRLDIYDDKLFADPPPKEECPICMLPMPHSSAGVCGLTKTYQPCCGKILCCGCVMAANKEMRKGNMKSLCPFCRVPLSLNDKEDLKRLKKRMKLNDVGAFYTMGYLYSNGDCGLPKNKNKSFELMNQAAELGSSDAHYNLGNWYSQGRHVVRDKNKATHHYMLAAIGGHELARFNLGTMEGNNRNHDKAMKHHMIAARCGFDESLATVGAGYKVGFVTKDDYASTLRAHKASQDEMKSEERTEVIPIRNRMMAKP